MHALTHPARLPDGKAEALHEIVRTRQIGGEIDATSDTPTADDVLAALDQEAIEDDETGIESGA